MPPTYFATTAGSFVFGVIGVKHSISGTEVQTSLSLRSASTPAKTQQHFAMIQASGAVQGKGLRPPKTPGAPSVTTCKYAAGTALYGLNITWAHPVNDGNNAWDEAEVHVSTVNNFTPTSATLRGTVRGTYFQWGAAAASTIYYIKIIHRDRMRNASLTGSQTNVTSPA